MAIGLGTALTSIGGSGIGKKIVRGLPAEQVGELAQGRIGIGSGKASPFAKEQLRQIPEGVPDSPRPDMGNAGRVYKHEGLTGPSLQLHPGFYDFDVLDRAGLHDEITTARIRDGYRVIFYTGVEGGSPAGQRVDVTGPTTVDLESRGLNDTVSSIAVFPRGQDQSPGGDTSPESDTVVSPSGQVMRRGGIFAQAGGQLLLFGLIGAALLWIANQ